ncbi:cytochrome P450 4C1-like [Copidosoma floridanum]|uniref:cytochrome P450 4C1-like n=1 Tax=Copidosoma floridanum TaxID=29053 RepID=UPI0006C96179|nr:cytochrome P450 4C1-like [Copidosoma floridanum]
MSTRAFNNYVPLFRDFSVALISVVLIASLVKYLLNKRRLFVVAAKLPGPTAYPIVGNALIFASDQLFERIVGILELYGNVTPMRLWMGPKLCIVITEPRDIEIVLHSPQSSTKGSHYRFFYPFIGNGLISGSGKTWKAHRKMVSHLFTQRTFEAFVATFNNRSTELVRKLKPLANGEVFDIFHYIEGCTIDICCETIMGHSSANALTNPNYEFIHHTAQMYQITYDRMLKAWLHPDWIFRMTARHRRQQRAKSVINDFTERCIESRRQETRDGVIGVSILHKLLAANEDARELNDEELRDEIYTVYIAAQDTLALTSSFAVLMMGIHESVQDKARNEVKEVLGDNDVDVEGLSKLKYVEMVIKETLRLFPVGPLLGRRLTGELKLDKCVLPKGCEVVMALYGTHRSPEYWDQPDEFIPERFSSENVSKRHPYAFVPFSGGPMGCIGKNYAIMALKTMLVNVIRGYVIKSDVALKDVKLRTDISVRSVHGYRVSLSSREKQRDVDE